VTKRTEFQQRTLEFKAVAMAWVANKLFSFKRTGLDGYLKKSMLKPKRDSEAAAE